MTFVSAAARGLALGFLVASSGCAYALHPPPRPNPRLAGSSLAALVAGMTEQDVRAHLGEPASRQSRPTASAWRYEEVLAPRGCDVLLFGVLPINRPQRETRAVDLRFGVGGLEAATLTERTGDRTVRTVLVQAKAATR
jgi:hypothetical protein